MWGQCISVHNALDLKVSLPCLGSKIGYCGFEGTIDAESYTEITIA